MTLQPHGKNTFWIRLTFVIWAIAFLLLCARSLVLKGERHSVYPVFTAAGENWMNGATLYKTASTEEFRYSPLVAAFFVPFDLMPARVGQFLWRSLNFFVYVGGLLYCCEVGLPRVLTRDLRAAVLLLVLPLSVGSLNNAQSNPMVIGLMLIAAASCLRERWMLAAIAIAAATLFKLYPVALGMLLVVLYPRKFSWRLLVCLAIGALLPFLLQRWAYVAEQYRLWAHYLAAEDRETGAKADWYRDLRAVWVIYVSPMSQQAYLIIEIAAGAMIAGVTWLAKRQGWSREALLAMALGMACCWMTALGPATESSTYILLAPSLAWAMVEVQGKSWLIGYVLVYALFLVSQLAINLPNGKWFRDSLQPLPIAGLMFLLLLLAESTARFCGAGARSHNV